MLENTQIEQQCETMYHVKNNKRYFRQFKLQNMASLTKNQREPGYFELSNSAEEMQRPRIVDRKTQIISREKEYHVTDNLETITWQEKKSVNIEILVRFESWDQETRVPTYPNYWPYFEAGQVSCRRTAVGSQNETSYSILPVGE